MIYSAKRMPRKIIGFFNIPVIHWFTHVVCFFTWSSDDKTLYLFMMKPIYLLVTSIFMNPKAILWLGKNQFYWCFFIPPFKN